MAFDPIMYGTKSLMHFDSAGGIAKDDSNFKNRAWLLSGATLSSNSKFGGYAYSGTGDGGNYLQCLAGASTLGVGTLPFSVEAWIYLTAINVWSGISAIFDFGGGGLIQGLGLRVNVSRGLVARMCGSGNTSYTISSANGLIALNTYHHVALCRAHDGYTRLFIDGVQVAITADATVRDLGATYTLAMIGNQYPSGSDGYGGFTGQIDEFRLVVGPEVYPTNFTPPISAFSDPTGQDRSELLALDRLWASAPAVPNLKLIEPVSLLADLYSGGRGILVGDVKIKGAPNYPAKRRVRLFRDRDGYFVRETWSHPVTGLWAFENIDETLSYTTITYDHTHDKRAVVADNLKPDLMP